MSPAFATRWRIAAIPCAITLACAPPVPRWVPALPDAANLAVSPEGRYVAFVRRGPAPAVGILDLTNGRTTTYPDTAWPVTLPLDSASSPTVEANLDRACWAVAPLRCAFTVWRGAANATMDLVVEPGGRSHLEAVDLPPDQARARGCSDCLANPETDGSRRVVGRFEYYAGRAGNAATIMVRDQRAGPTREIARFSRVFHDCHASELRVDPTGRRLAFKVACGLGNTWFGNLHRVYLMTLPDGRPRLVAGAERGPVAWLPDGSAFFVLVRDEDTRDLRLGRVDVAIRRD